LCAVLRFSPVADGAVAASATASSDAFREVVSTPYELSVTSLSDGQLVASWQSFDEAADPLIRACLFNADGSRASHAFVVNAGALQNPPRNQVSPA
jgi:hypothetical protein